MPPLNRWNWFGESTIGAESLLGGGLSAGFGTLTDQPREYGPHWLGFAQRYGMRLTGVATGNAIEGGVGAMIHEDPRYWRIGETGSIKSRAAAIIKQTFLARDDYGHTKPAYARYLAVSGNNFISNTWRADSEADVSHALIRTGTGFLGRMGGNAFDEFWPDIKNKFFRKRAAKEKD